MTTSSANVRDPPPSVSRLDGRARVVHRYPDERDHEKRWHQQEEHRRTEGPPRPRLGPRTVSGREPHQVSHDRSEPRRDGDEQSDGQHRRFQELEVDTIGVHQHGSTDNAVEDGHRRDPGSPHRATNGWATRYSRAARTPMNMVMITRPTVLLRVNRPISNPSSLVTPLTASSEVKNRIAHRDPATKPTDDRTSDAPR